jgi:hypothetical protein
VKIPFPDGASWKAYQNSRGRLSRDDWRRDNVNRFIARIYREVHAAKPWVRVGISPFGIYRPGSPAGIRGLDQYQSLYADPKLWLAQGWLDYLAPQLYWRSDAPAQSFPVLLKWWAENNPRRRMIVAGLNTTALGAAEILQQIKMTREQAGVVGHIHWNMSALMKNKGGVGDALARSSYSEIALTPALDGGAKPSKPKAVVRMKNGGVEIDFRGNAEANVYGLLIQTRNDRGEWESVVKRAQTLLHHQSPAPSAVSVRAMDEFGNLSDANVFQRTEAPPPSATKPQPETQPRNAPSPRNAPPLRRGK